MGLDKSSSVAMRSLALWSRSKHILDNIPSRPPATDAQVSVKVDGSIMHFRSRWQVDGASNEGSPSPMDTAPTALVTKPHATAPPSSVEISPPPLRKRSRHFFHARPTHLFTRVCFIQGSRQPYIVSVDEDGSCDEGESKALVFRAYGPHTSRTSHAIVSIVTLQTMIPELHAPPLYFRDQLPSLCRHALYHWGSWCTSALPSLCWKNHHLTMRFPSALKTCHVLQYKGVCLFRCVVQVHVMADFSVDIAAVDVATDQVFYVHAPVPLLQVHCPEYLQYVQVRHRWPALFKALVGQLWLEYTTKGFELLVAGQAPHGRILLHPLMNMSDVQFQNFLQLEHDRLARVRDECVRLAASVALRKELGRQEVEQQHRLHIRRSHAATSIQRVFRGHLGRIVFYRAVCEDACANHILGAMPGTRFQRAAPCRDGWFQDPHTLMAFGISRLHPVAGVRCRNWIVTRHDMNCQVLNDLHRLIQQAIAAQCIQGHVRRWLCQRRYRSVYRGVVSFQYQVRGALRRRYQRLHRALHGLSFPFARRIRNTWLLFHVRLRPPKTHYDDGWYVDLAGTHPHAGVSARQRISMARLVANGTFYVDEWRGMANVDVATRIADATDLFYSAQSHLMTFGVGPTKRTSWEGI
ncbi:hypothetical protein, variant [Aphanomyces invadans]|nr:hypothetical protein, variant [Aphanomyces invadans]ETW05190.1 hypothetical protein, variant [Aphanomyces invadans]|eukprot:XP_008866627.1 hypothetical protein, variant [Aphanomyces invadans]